MKNDIAISVKNVTKDFHLPRHKSDSIKQAITQAFKPKDKTADTHHALKGVSFDIKKGEFFGVLGRNGSGKSTLLKIISEIYRPTSGSVTHHGKLVAFIELGVGFKAELTGRENVYLNGALLGFSKKEIDELYDEIVAFAELEEFMEQKLKNYSSGMKVRLAFAVAIQAKSDILILDEVLAVGDAAFQRKCFDYFKSLKRSNKTIVFVTHNMNAAREYCDQGILINEGVITHAGDIEDVADAYLQLFNKSTQGNQINGTERNGDQSVTVKHFDMQHDKQKVAFSAVLRASNHAYEGVKFGLAIHDGSGRLVAGLNNLNVEGAQKLSFTPGEEKRLMFEIENIFGNDTYDITVNVNRSSGTVVCDQLKEATSFSNMRSNAHYPVVCPAKLTIQ